MYETLTEKQKEIVDCNKSHIIVKACPGSGKTYSVAARIAKLLESGTYRHTGIATLSFTNNACNEIKTYLNKFCKINNLAYPHHIGTLDSFINNYIFLPYGHLFMKCNKRPEIIGTEYNRWFEYDSSKRNNYTQKIIDPDYYFDKVSFNKQDILFPLHPYINYHFGKSDWINQYKVNGEMKKVISDIANSKYKFFKEGKANQSDANYIAYKTLLEYPQIAKNIANKFPIIIIDEAQDTTEIQMAILDVLDGNKLDSIMLIGDPNQAIFEWNTADSGLFLEKFEDELWHPIDLNENRRSSEKICSILNNFYENNIVSISDSKHCQLVPQLKEHNASKESVSSIKDSFLEECLKEGITEDKIAIVYRGTSFGEEFFDLADNNIKAEDLPWVNKKYHVRDLIHGKYLLDNGYLKNGYKLIEKSYHRLVDSQLKYVSSSYIQNQILNKSYRTYRSEIFDFISQLPSTNGLTVSEWIRNANYNLETEMPIKKNKADVLINKLFLEKDLAHNYDFYLDTIHSVKGSTYDAILVFLKKSGSTKDYKNIIKANYNEPDVEKKKKDLEEIRIVYVACSRPKKLLWLAVHEGEHANAWKSKLFND